MALLIITLLAAAATITALAVRHRQVRNRWVSPYAGFRVAAAKVTRTAEGQFDIAGARMVQAR